jgi:hypothetical protein
MRKSLFGIGLIAALSLATSGMFRNEFSGLSVSSSTSRQSQRASRGWSNAYVRRMAKKTRNVKRHRAARKG